jgi:hypothetical protein
MTPDRQQEALAAALRVDPRELKLAVQLMRSGRADLIAAVIAGRSTVRQALASAQRGLRK